MQGKDNFYKQHKTATFSKLRDTKSVPQLL